MANTFKNIKKKLRRKRLLAEKRHLEKAQAGAGGNEAARRKIKAALRRKKAVLKPVAVILIAVFSIFSIIPHPVKVIQSFAPDKSPGFLPDYSGGRFPEWHPYFHNGKY